MVGSLLALACAATPILVDASPARALELTQALTRDGSFTDFDETLRTPPRPVAEAEAHLQALPALLRSLGLEEIDRRLMDAEQTLRLADARISTRQWLELWVFRGFAKHLKNENAPAVGGDELVAAFAIEPTLEVDLPKAERFAKWVSQQRRKASEVRRTRHRVTSQTPSAIWIDGTMRGTTAVDVELTIGPHVVSAESPGRERFVGVLEVTASGATTLPTGAALAPDQAELRAAIIDAARNGTPPKNRLPAAGVVVIQDVNGSIRAVRVSSFAVASAGSLDSPTASSLELALAAQGGAAQAPPFVVGEAERVGLKVPVVVSFVSASVLAVGAAITFGVAQSTFTRAGQIPQVEASEYSRTMNEGRGLMVASGVLTGLVALASALGLWFLFD
jgi:hypothetical protein